MVDDAAAKSKLNHSVTVRSASQLLSPLQAKLIYGLGNRRAALVLRTGLWPATRAPAVSEVDASARTTPRAVPSADLKVIAQTVSSHQ